jgi:hypothetical protein
LIIAAFLFPLALYCLVLGMINRRRRPLMIPATWDFAGILFAASGFLLCTVPAILSSCSDERWRLLWLFGPNQDLAGKAPSLAGNLVSGHELWMGVSACYFVVVVSLAGWVLWRRRHQTAIYNIEPAAFEESLAAALDTLALVWSRSGNHFLLRRSGRNAPDHPAAAAEPIPVVPTEPMAQHAEWVRLPREKPLPQRTGGESDLSTLEDQGQAACLDLDLAPLLRHVTLRWNAAGDSSLCEQVEKELAHVLSEVRTWRNPVGGFLLTLSGILLSFTFLTLMTVLVFRVFSR